MSDYISRLYLEHSELAMRVKKLNEFVISDVYNTLPALEQSDLREQLKHMMHYLEVVSRRVSRTCDSA